MTRRLLIFTLFFSLFSFTDNDRSLIEQQYNALAPTLRTEPLKVLQNLQNLYKKAEKSLDSRDTLLANIQFSLAKVYCDKNMNYAEGILLYQKALDTRLAKLPFGNAKIGINAGNLALALRHMGLPEQARTYAQLAIDAKKAATKIDTNSLARSYNELAVANRYLGNYADALAIADKVFELTSATHDSFQMAGSRITAGSVHFLTQKYEAAIREYQMALTFYNDMLKRKTPNDPSVFAIQKERAATLNNLGATYRNLKKYDASLNCLNQSLDAYQNLLESTKDASFHIAIGNIFAERAQTLNTIGDKGRAASDFEIALTTFNNSSNPLSIECFTKYGNFLKQNGQMGAALSLYNRGIATALNQNKAENAPLNNVAFPELLDIFAAKAFMLKEKQEISAAFVAFQKCDTLIQSLLEKYQADQSKYLLSDKALPIYESAIGLALSLGQKQAAINFAERNKALVLYENLQDNKAKNFGGVPQHLLNEEHHLRAEIAYLEKQLYESQNDSLRKITQGQVFNAKEKWHRFNQNLAQQFPKYFDLKNVKNAPLSISDIQQNIDNQTLVVSYFVGDSTLFAFAFSKNDCQVFSQKRPPQYDSRFKLLKKSLSNERFITDSTSFAEQAFCAQSHAFFKDLMDKPLSILNKNKSLTRLRIVPDGFLGYLPFELLLTTPADRWKGGDVPYLLRQYAVSYAYSLRLLNDTEGVSATHDFGGFGIEYDDETIKNLIKADSIEKKPPTISRSEVLSRLAFADDEVKNIQSLLGGGQIWLNAGATKSAFMQQAPQCGIVHLAMHGAIDEKNPLNSGLIFSKTDSSKDYFLSGYDLFAMQFKTGLAVLSACNTGNGELRRSEGVMSLARAFAYAGCPSTVMSLWSIPDESTSKVMLAFYKNLKNGEPKDIALQKAKLDYLDNCPPQYSIPNEWGATVVIGQIAPIDFRAWWQKPWFLSSLALFLLVLSILGFRKKSVAAVF
ncbi:MAG: CHAT domain-containing protein [Saprospiraceae bacterium]|nr:CHAT domain-containing protein [Saprospiraceae bacterium]